jgi:hypothetical protein
MQCNPVAVQTAKGVVLRLMQRAAVHRRGLGDFLDRAVGRSLTIKFSRMFDVLQ